MFHLHDDFTVKNAYGRPYTLRIEKSSSLDHDHAHVSEEGYSLDCSGNKYILCAPSTESFCFSTRFEYKYLCFLDVGVCWVLHFGYKEEGRNGNALSFMWLTSGEINVALLKTTGDKAERVSEITIGKKTAEEASVYEMDLLVENGHAKGHFAGFEYDMEIEEPQCGLIALERRHAIGAVVFKEYTLVCKDELCEEELTKRCKVEIPMRNGGSVPYTFEYGMVSVGGCKYFSYAFDGGIYTLKDDRPKKEEQYLGEIDYFKHPYMRIFSGGKELEYPLAEDELTFCHQYLHWPFLKEYLGGSDLPMSGYIPLEDNFPSDKYFFAFGYEALDAEGYRYQNDGATEFIYDENGELVYEGMPLTDDAYELVSPHDKAAVKLIPENCYDRDTVIRHFENNHYFTPEENIDLTMRLGTRREIRYMRVEAAILDVYGNAIGETKVINSAAANIILNVPFYEYRLVMESMPVGVYRVRFTVYYGDAVLHEYTKVFEVFEPNGEQNPPLESGLPVLFSMPMEEQWLERACFDPWNPLPSCDAEHFMAFTCFPPDLAMKKRTWEITRIFGRKWYCWLDRRSVNDWNYKKYPDVVKNADYLYYPTAFGQSPLRNDLWAYGCYEWATDYDPEYRDGLKNCALDFLREHPDYAEEIGWHEGDPFLPETLTGLHRVCQKEYYSYMHKRIREQVLKQNEMFREINPNWKRAGYGPMPIYAMAQPSYHYINHCGCEPDNTLAKEVFTGFCQLEDYPYSCAYHTHRSAFAIMTFLLHAPDLVLYPEQYYKMIGCRDLYVKNAHPPIADYDVPLCFHTTTAYDYAYNTPHMDKDGFHYWNTYGFMKLDGSFEEIDPLVRGWEQVNLHRPERPERTTAFIADYDMADDRFENDARFIYNISSDGHYFLYRCSREAGIPSGFVLRWDSLETLTAEDTDLLVLPCMTNAPANAVEHIRRLYHEGVSLIGIGNVDGLEDLFGVKQSHRKTEVTRLEAFGETEYITPYVAEFFYTADGAAVYASANGEEVILRNGRTALINVPLSQIGRYNYHEMKPIQGEDTVSALLHRVGRTLMREMSNPLAKADHAALTAFRDVNGEKMLLAINYTPYRAMNNEPGSVEVSIKLDMPGIISAESEYAIESLCHDGETLKEINLRLEPFDAAMIHLIEA